MRGSAWGLLLLLVGSASVSASEWLRWTTPSLPDVPAFCCATKDGAHAQLAACKLEGGNAVYGRFDGAPRSGHAQVYARYDEAVLTDVRIFDGACGVAAASPVRDLGALDTDASLSRLLAPVPGSQRAVRDRLVAVALHPGARASTWLQQRSRDGANEERRDAWFWLGQRLGARVEPLVRAALPTARGSLREHLVFVLSQMPEPAGVDALIALVEDRTVDRGLRGRALFWLAQSDDDRAYAWLDRRLDSAEP